MPDWLIAYLGTLQGSAVRALATELRSGGLGMAGLAFTLGALHALTPGHGKAAVIAYFVGKEASLCKGIRVALVAALLHVVSGFAAFLVLRFALQQMPSMTQRGSPTFTAVGYGLIVLAGLILLWQGMHHRHTHLDGAHALTAGIGLLPCPLTISILGFAWLQGNAVTIGLVLASLALGIGFTIALVAVIAITARRLLGASFRPWLQKLEDGSRVLQVAAGSVIVIVGLWMMLSVR